MLTAIVAWAPLATYEPILFDKLCIAQQNRSIGVNVVSKGSPSLIRKVRRISLGMTIRPRSSTLLTMPVAFIVYLSPFLQGYKASLVQREVAARRADGGIAFIVHYNPPVSSADSPLYTRGPFPVPTIILQITLLVSVNKRRLYRHILTIIFFCVIV